MTPTAPTPAERLYERIWNDQATREQYVGGNLRIDRAIAAVGPGRRLLDLGCGDGVLGQALRDRFEEVVGADISESALEAAARRGLITQRINADSPPFPFPDSTFDAITCLDLIEHVFEPRVLVTEIARILAPGGVLYLATPNMRYLLRIKELALGRFPKTSGDTEYAWDGGHLHYFTPQDLRELLAERGLRTVSEWGIVSPGVRGNWKYRLLRAVLPERLERELLSIEIFTKAVKS